MWGDPLKPQTNTNHTQRAADITEQFEKLYERATAEGGESSRAMAMMVEMTTCSRCRMCSSMIFDEEIMAGWTAEVTTNYRTVFWIEPFQQNMYQKIALENACTLQRHN